jgi:hypothetical protein
MALRVSVLLDWRPPLAPGIFLVLISVRGQVITRAIMWLGGRDKLEMPVRWFKWNLPYVEISTLWEPLSCILTQFHLCFDGAYCLHHQCRSDFSPFAIYCHTSRQWWWRLLPYCPSDTASCRQAVKWKYTWFSSEAFGYLAKSYSTSSSTFIDLREFVLNKQFLD